MAEEAICTDKVIRILLILEMVLPLTREFVLSHIYFMLRSVTILATWCHERRTYNVNMRTHTFDLSVSISEFEERTLLLPISHRIVR